MGIEIVMAQESLSPNAPTTAPRNFVHANLQKIRTIVSGTIVQIVAVLLFWRNATVMLQFGRGPRKRRSVMSCVPLATSAGLLKRNSLLRASTTRPTSGSSSVGRKALLCAQSYV